MDVWEVVGFEKVEKQNRPGEYSIRLYVQRELKDGVDGQGLECARLFFNPGFVKYDPVVGHRIIATEGRYGIDRIYVVA